MSEPIDNIKVVLIRQLIRKGESNRKAGKLAGVSASRIQREREAMKQISFDVKKQAGAALGFVV